MQDEAVLTGESDKAKLPSPQKYIVVPEKSVSTYESYQTEGSKRSTEEEELRSLSTTPRFSHEDLGRIVSPPHSSDFSTETEPDFRDNFEDTLSAKEVYLKSRTSQFTHHTTLPVLVSDKDSVHSYQTQKTKSDFPLDKAWVNQVHEPYNKVFPVPEKEIITSGKPIPDKGFSFYEEVSLKSRVTSTAAAPELPPLKARKGYQDKPNHTDQDFKNSEKSLTGTEYNQSRRHSGNNNLGQLRLSASTNYSRLRAEELMELRMSSVDGNLKDIIMDAESTHRRLITEQDHRRMLENQLQEIDEERKDLNTKLATLRVKLGVANSNFNVSKNECDQMRKKYQETQIQKARLEERIQASSKELERLKDPNNPESNVNMKKIVLNDRKEIRRLRTDLEGVRSERSEVQKQIQDKDEKIKMLNIYIGEAKDQLSECNREFETAQISVTGERKKREEVEIKYNELMIDKKDFDERMGEIQSQLDIAITGTSGIQKQSDEYRDKEQTLAGKIDVVEKKLRDTLTAVEQQKNRNMPYRTATSIKHHQYRMTTSGWVTDTTPHVIVTTNANGSMASSGFLGKTVVSTKPVKSLPAGKAVSRTTARSKGSSLPDRK